MSRILTIKQAIETSKQLTAKNKRIVLAGGVFDILHPGHITFLEKAKEQGDVLLVWVEDDTLVKKRKGPDRPVHTQQDRARVLAALSAVDYVLLLPELLNNESYDHLVKNLKPAIIAATKDDPVIAHKQRQAKLIGAKLAIVTERIKEHSTSRLIKQLNMNKSTLLPNING